jgi:hypothetical protein
MMALCNENFGQHKAILLGFARQYGAVGEGSKPVALVEPTIRVLCCGFLMLPLYHRNMVGLSRLTAQQQAGAMSDCILPKASALVPEISPIARAPRPQSNGI